MKNMIQKSAVKRKIKITVILFGIIFFTICTFYFIANIIIFGQRKGSDSLATYLMAFRWNQEDYLQKHRVYYRSSEQIEVAKIRNELKGLPVMTVFLSREETFSFDKNPLSYDLIHKYIDKNEVFIPFVNDYEYNICVLYNNEILKYRCIKRKDQKTELSPLLEISK